eukprot:SAG22_NODE_1649_length_3898_cov_3.561990_2_plen_148_part_00
MKDTDQNNLGLLHSLKRLCLGWQKLPTPIEEPTRCTLLMEASCALAKSKGPVACTSCYRRLETHAHQGTRYGTSWLKNDCSAVEASAWCLAGKENYCEDQLDVYCGGEGPPLVKVGQCYVCTGATHVVELRAAGCTEDQFESFCSGN